MNLIKSMMTVGGYTLLYRISSFARDILQANILGAGIFSDAFVTAFKFANILRKLFSEGSFNAAFLPKFSAVLGREGKPAAERIASQVLTWLVIVVGLLSVVGLVFFPSIIRVYAPGYDPDSERFQATVTLGRICFPYIAASFFTALFSGVLNSINKFAVPTASQLVLNISLMVALALGFMGFSDVAYWMAMSVCIAGIIQVAVVWGYAFYNGFRISLTSDLFSQETKDIFKKIIPGTIGAGVWQFNVIIAFILVSSFSKGITTCFYYADHTNQLPLGILGIALSTALLPPLTKFIRAKDYNSANDQFNLGVLFALSFTIPAVIAFTVIPGPITSMIYESGKFGAEQVKLTAPAVAAFAAGLPAYVLAKVFSSAFFANGDTKTPLIAGAAAMAANVISIFVLRDSMQHVGIAAAISVAAWVNAIMLFVFLRKYSHIVKVLPETYVAVSKKAVAAAAMGIVIFVLDSKLEYLYANGKSVKVACVSGIITVGVLVFWGVGRVIGSFRLMKEFSARARAPQAAA